MEVEGVEKTPKGNPKTKRTFLPYQMSNIILNLKAGSPIIAGIELVHSMKGQGVSSMFSMGYGLGLWEGIFAGLELPLEKVTPQAWKKVFLGKGAGSDKHASIVRAQALIPGAARFLTLAKHDGRAEAMLMAEYFRRIQTQTKAA